MILIVLAWDLKHPEIELDSISIWYDNLQKHFLYVQHPSVVHHCMAVLTFLATVLSLQYEFEWMGSDDSPWIQCCYQVCWVYLPHLSML